MRKARPTRMESTSGDIYKIPLLVFLIVIFVGATSHAFAPLSIEAWLNYGLMGSTLASVAFGYMQWRHAQRAEVIVGVKWVQSDRLNSSIEGRILAVNVGNGIAHSVSLTVTMRNLRPTAPAGANLDYVLDKIEDELKKVGPRQLHIDFLAGGSETELLGLDSHLLEWGKASKAKFWMLKEGMSGPIKEDWFKAFDKVPYEMAVRESLHKLDSHLLCELVFALSYTDALDGSRKKFPVQVIPTEIALTKGSSGDLGRFVDFFAAGWMATSGDRNRS